MKIYIVEKGKFENDFTAQFANFSQIFHTLNVRFLWKHDKKLKNSIITKKYSQEIPRNTVRQIRVKLFGLKVLDRFSNSNLVRLSRVRIKLLFIIEIF
jgi:hypothetical protein